MGCVDAEAGLDGNHPPFQVADSVGDGLHGESLLPSVSPSGARAKMLVWWETNKRALKRWGWSLSDLPTLQAWAFLYDASPYGTLPKWENDKGKPMTPSLPRPKKKKAFVKPDEPVVKKKTGFGGILFAIIAALTALRRG